MKLADTCQSLLLGMTLVLTTSIHASVVSSVDATGRFADLGMPLFCSDMHSGGLTATAGCNISVSPDPFHLGVGMYQASASYTQLDTSSISDILGSNGSDLIGSATARFSDTLMLTGHTGTGKLVFAVEWWGQSFSEECENCLGASVMLNDVSVPGIHIGVPELHFLTFDFTFGAPFALTGSAEARSSALTHEDAMTEAHLMIESIQVQDTSGAQITDYSVSSAAGATYPFVSLPEPRSIELMTLSGIILALWKLRKIRARRNCELVSRPKA
jgi:hypothetical protein